MQEPGRHPSVLPLLAGYWSFGQFWGLWVILVHEFLTLHKMSESRLGLLYTLLSVVAVAAMVVVAPRMQPLALRVSVPVSLAALAVGTAAIAYLPSQAIWLGFALVGVGNGLIDVFMNVAAQRAEVLSRRPVLQWLHASYAAGGVTGALVSGAIIHFHHDFRLALAYGTAALIVTAIWNARTAPRERGSRDGGAAFSITPLFRSPALWVPALAVLFAFLVEGSMDTWSGLYLREELGATASVAALAFTAFGTAVFLGRMFAGKVLFGLGARTTIVISGAGSAVAGALAVATHNTWVVGVAYLLLGFAISAAAPAAFGLIEGLDEDPTASIAAVTTVGYTGFIWSPPLLGYIAQTVSLRAAMSVIVVATLGIVAAGMAARPTHVRADPP
jgi:MFS family permease